MECIFKIASRLAGETNYHISAYAGTGNPLPDGHDTVTEQLPVVTPPHQAEYPVAAALKGHMNMRHYHPFLSH